MTDLLYLGGLGRQLDSYMVNQLWFSTVYLACCKTFAICCKTEMELLVSNVLSSNLQQWRSSACL